MGRQPIAILQHDLRIGGAERMMVNLAREWAGRGAAVDLVLVQRQGIYLPLVPQEVRIVDLGAHRTLTALPALVRYLRSAQPRALLSGLVHINTLALLAKPFAPTGTRFVISERNTPSVDSRDQPFTSRLSYRMARWIYPRADAIIAVSGGVADDLAHSAALPRDRIVVVNNPVVTPSLLAQAREPFDHPWFAEGEPPVVLGVGRLAEAKDFATLIRAFAELRATRACRLMILGEGELRDDLEQLARSLGVGGDVELYGATLNPYAIMSRARLLVLSSRWEGSPNVLVEALACGLPVVSTDCPSGPRETLENGRYGPLVAMGDADGMARAMGEVLDAPLPPEVLRERAQRFHVSVAALHYLQTMLDGQDMLSDRVPTSSSKLA